MVRSRVGQPGGGQAARAPAHLHGAVGTQQHRQGWVQRIQRRRGLRHAGTVPRQAGRATQLSPEPEPPSGRWGRNRCPDSGWNLGILNEFWTAPDESRGDPINYSDANEGCLVPPPT